MQIHVDTCVAGQIPLLLIYADINPVRVVNTIDAYK